ncbi:hypothetical protein HANVADRAFT_26913 [Hanseniaspora valbyensis NRRL Y-1626]|uniref:CRCB-domain-containing protein n=1 Tax=Hanseniaspora valbyensis NRRL Y-1626 TaxID=766949 RepID=A0A1B7T9U8_9ASCO|nr:hypothetical protein HANVADRAFT_26913 [Hanseniaspora valbyensis NRRL Y-1626]
MDLNYSVNGLVFLFDFHVPFIAASIIANISRISLLKLNYLYTDSYVKNGTILYANFTACIFMGILQSFKFEDGDLQTCLTTGFCGSFSSLSTYIWELFIHTVIRAHTYPNRGYSISEFIVGNIVEVSVSMSGLKFGISLGSFIKENYNINSKKLGKIIKYTLALLSIPLLIIMLVLSIAYRHKFDSYWCLSSLFGIFGTYGRFYLSKLNSSSTSQKWQFPVGTFLTNFIASTVLAILLVLLERYTSEYTKKWAIYSLMEGFTASLSTMSTFMNEMNKLKFLKSGWYLVITIFSCYSMFIIILGSYKWTKGLYNIS